MTCCARAPTRSRAASVEVVKHASHAHRARQESLIDDGTVDAIGLGRPFIEHVDVAAGLLRGTLERIDVTPCPVAGIQALPWWTHQLKRLADGRDVDIAYGGSRLQRDMALGLLQQTAATTRRITLERLRPGAWPNGSAEIRPTSR